MLLRRDSFLRSAEVSLGSSLSRNLRDEPKDHVCCLRRGPRARELRQRVSVVGRDELPDVKLQRTRELKINVSGDCPSKLYTPGIQWKAGSTPLGKKTKKEKLLLSTQTRLC